MKLMCDNHSQFEATQFLNVYGWTRGYVLDGKWFFFFVYKENSFQYVLIVWVHMCDHMFLFTNNGVLCFFFVM